MSFLSEKMMRLAGPASRMAVAARTPRAAFSMTAVMRKSPTESVKDGLKKADRTVSDNIVLPGLDAATKAKDTVKETAQGMTKSDAKAAANEAKGKAEELKGQAKGTAHEAAGKVKGAAEQAKGKL